MVSVSVVVQVYVHVSLGWRVLSELVSPGLELHRLALVIGHCHVAQRGDPGVGNCVGVDDLAAGLDLGLVGLLFDVDARRCVGVGDRGRSRPGP